MTGSRSDLSPDMRGSLLLLVLLLACHDRSAPTWPVTAIIGSEPGDVYVTVDWPAPNESDVLVYVLHVNGEERARVTTGSQSYVVRELVDGKRYTVAVTAIDRDGNVSAPLEREVQVIDRTPPAWREDARIGVSSDDPQELERRRVYLAWPPPLDAVQYRLRRDDEDLGFLEEPEYLDQGVELRPETTYEVRAYDTEDNESETLTVTWRDTVQARREAIGRW